MNQWPGWDEKIVYAFHMMLLCMVHASEDWEYATDVSSMKEMTPFQENSCWGRASGVFCRIKSGFNDMGPSRMGLCNVSKDQEHGGMELECITTPGVAAQVGQRDSMAHVTVFNHFAMPPTFLVTSFRQECSFDNVLLGSHGDEPTDSCMSGCFGTSLRLQWASKPKEMRYYQWAPTVFVVQTLVYESQWCDLEHQALHFQKKFWYAVTLVQDIMRRFTNEEVFFLQSGIF